MTVVWISIIVFWLLTGALVTIVNAWIVHRRVRKVLEQYRKDEQKYINKEEALALQTRAGKKLPAWMKILDEDLEDTK